MAVSDKYYPFAKRFFDILISGVAVVILTPLLAPMGKICRTSCYALDTPRPQREMGELVM